MTERSIFDACRRRREAGERLRQARAKRMAVVAAGLGAERVGNYWELRCPHCGGLYKINGDGFLDDAPGRFNCASHDPIWRTLHAAREAESDDEAKEIVKRAIGPDAAEGES